MNRRTQALRQFIPGRWRRWLRRLFRPPLYQGDYPSWQEARLASSGYSSCIILEKVIQASRAVRDGRALWERDTVLFHEPAANEPLLRALRDAANSVGGRLSVVDFGGALGSAWWQHRPWLKDLNEVRWSVVEQPALVAAGQREFTVGPLRFYQSLAECRAFEAPTVLLLSSVLPYLENPRALLREISNYALRDVIIDRTGFVSRGRDRLTVQRVPPAIYDATYPCWFFDRATFLEGVEHEWRVVTEWITDDEVDIDAEHRGMLLKRTGS